MARASVWILVMAVLFAGCGTIQGFATKSEADQALANLAGFEDDEIYPQPIEGEMLTVGELENMIHTEVRLVFITNYVLAAIMLGLFFWCKKSPLAASTTALCVYLAVIVLNAIIDPTTLVQGIIIKLFFFAAMIAAIKAALYEQKMAPPPDEAQAVS